MKKEIIIFSLALFILFLFNNVLVSAEDFTWTENLNNGIIHYWTLNETSGQALDSVGTMDSIVVEQTILQGAEGKVGTSYKLNKGSYNGIYFTKESYPIWTISAWFFLTYMDY